MSSRLNSYGGRLAAIAIAALLVRVVYTVLVGRHTPGVGDFFYYHEIANLIADGRGFVDPFLTSRADPYPSALHPPLWPLLLSISSKLGFTSILAHRLVGAFVGTATVVLIGLIGRRCAGERAGLLAAGIAAVYPTLVAADGSLMSETLYGLFVATALLLALRLLDQPGPGVAAGLGAALGLAALTRGEGVLFLALLALPVAWLAARKGRLARTGAVVAAASLVIAPWTIRNWTTFDQPVLISTNDSTVLAGANCDAVYSGPEIGYWSLGCISERRPGLTEAEQADVWREQGRGYATEHLRRVLAVVVPVRLLRSFDLYQPRRQSGDAEGRSPLVTQAGVAVWYLLLGLAAFGAFLLRHRRRLLAVLLSPLVVVAVSTALSFGLPRFRHALEITVVVLGAVAVDELMRRRRQRLSAAEAVGSAVASAG